MRFIIILIIISFIISGCSGAGNIAAPAENLRDLESPGQVRNRNRNPWALNLYHISDDHTTIEKLTHRNADYHFNVTPFVEPPKCSSCLMIGNPQIQGDGTIKVKVILSHPFPNQPEFTGFDVKGTVIFQATRKWKKKSL